MTTSVRDQIWLLSIATPYIGMWWWALRIVCGRRLVPWEWIPLAVCALAVPYQLSALLDGHSMKPFIMGAWMLLPIPVILWSGAVRLRRKRARNRILRDIDEARREFALGQCKLTTVDELMKEIRS